MPFDIAITERCRKCNAPEGFVCTDIFGVPQTWSHKERYEDVSLSRRVATKQARAREALEKWEGVGITDEDIPF